MQSGIAHTGDMPVRLHHIVIDAHDLPGLARFWTQALGWDRWVHAGAWPGLRPQVRKSRPYMTTV